MRGGKSYLVSILIGILLVYIWVLRGTQREVQPRYIEPHQQLNIDYSGKNRSVKLILAYTNVYGRLLDISTFGRSGYEIQHIANPLEACEDRCRWTTNKSDFNNSDAVLFHMYNNQQNTDFVLQNLPNRHSQDQKWILMAREPQAFYYPHQLTLLQDTFNLTMTFQSDSDISIPYGAYWQLPPSSLAYRAKMKMDYSTGKDKMVAWLVSNCKTSSRREEYVRELQKYISVDIYGKCGNLTTNTSSANGFRDQIAKRYKFYIAFENADCDDYISEKFWNSLRIGIIPIVRGQRAHYEKLAPPNSFINADSFITPQKLADHLRQVSSNFTLFHTYHEWRRLFDADYKFFTTNSKWHCELCSKIHNSPKQTVDVYEHFSEDKRCFTYLSSLGRDRRGEHVEDIQRP